MSRTPSPYEIFLSRFGTFTDVQQKSIGVIGNGKNCLMMAPTGSGKTEAALLPILNRIYKKEKRKGIYAVYITPLRALNRDLMKRLESICRESGITVSVRHGDTGQAERKRQTENPPDLLITTPETLQTIFLSGKLKLALKTVEAVVVDEIHELYYNKRGAQLSVGLERLREISGEFQRIGISATVGDVSATARFLFGSMEHEVVKAANLKEFRMSVEMPIKPRKDHKQFRETFGLDMQTVARIERVTDLIRESAATILFTNTRQAAESLGSKLVFLDRSDPFGGVSVHHSSLDRDERIRVENDFKEGRIKAIIATSSLELGIDVGRVDLAIQYGSPKQAIRLVQRIGRAGHREKSAAVGRIIVAEVLDAIEAAVIVDKAVNGQMERRGIEECALDVAFNQICAMALEHKKIEASRVYATIVSAYPFARLSRETFDKIVQLGVELRIIKSGDGFLGIGGRGLDYFFSNISVIPDSIRFSVKNLVNNKIISSLDEKFVYNYLDTGTSFITKGMPWRVVSIEDNVIFAEPSSDVEASVPDWEGEDIPVSREVASAVFSAMEADGIIGGVEIDENVRDAIGRFIVKQKEHFTPESGKVFVEEQENYALVHTGLGKLGNEFLTKVIGSVVLREYAGASMRATPYAIVIEFGESSRRIEMRRVFAALSEGMSPERIGNVVAASDVFRYRFVQVAKLFGIVDKKAAVTKSAATRLIDFYRNSPVFEEAMRDLYKNSFDADTVIAFLKDLKAERIKPVFVKSDGSPLAKEILKAAYHYREMLVPNLPSERDVSAFKGAVEGKDVRLLCTFCGFVNSETIEVERDVKYLCKSCRSPLLAMDRDEYEEAVSRKRAGKKLTPKEQREYYDAMKEAGLISAYGNRAVIALVTYGVGLSTAARILKFVRNDMNRFYTDIIEAQRTFVRTKKYWQAKAH